MFRNWQVLALAVVLVGFVATVGAAPAGEQVPAEVPAGEAVPVEGPGQEAEGDGLEIEGITAVEDSSRVATGITCTFNCNDGIGVYYQCPHPTFGQCCSVAQSACASHGGLDSGICSNGRLGLSCTPLDL